MTKKSHKISSSDSKLITLKLEEKCRLENQNNNNNIDKQEGLEGTKVRKEGSIKHLGITLTASPTIQHTDLLHFIAKKERKVLELREELKRNEEELSLLKKKWETIFTNQIINSPESPINNNKDNEDNNNNNNNNAITATNGDRNKQDGNGKENENVNGVGVGVGVGENENDDDDQSDDVEVIKLMNGLSKGIVGVVNGIKNVAESEVTQEKLSKIRTVVADVANYEPVKQTKKMTFDFTSHAFDNITKGFSSIAQSETIRNARRKTLETVYQLNEVLAPTSPPPPPITSNNSIYASSPISTSPPPLPSTSTFSSSTSSSSSTFSSSSSPSSTTSTNPNSPKTPIQQTWSPTSQTFGVFTIQNSKQSDEIISTTTTTTTKSKENNYDYNEESLYLFNELF